MNLLAVTLENLIIEFVSLLYVTLDGGTQAHPDPLAMDSGLKV